MDKVPLTQLMGAAYVIDVSDKTASDRDYRLSVADVQSFEREHGRIPAGAIVLLRTGWDRKWPDRKAYMGDDTPRDWRGALQRPVMSSHSRASGSITETPAA